MARRLTEDEKARRAAERKAERTNAKRVAEAPLLAHAGLVEMTDADAEQQRRADAATHGWWGAQARLQHEAQQWAQVGWLSMLAGTLLSEDDHKTASQWVASSQTSQIYVWLRRWEQVIKAATTGGDIIPASELIAPSACWPDIDARRDDLKAAWSEHDAAGCSREWCMVRQAGPPRPYVPGVEAQTW